MANDVGGKVFPPLLTDSRELTPEEAEQVRRSMAAHLAWWWEQHPEQRGKMAMYSCQSPFYHLNFFLAVRVWGEFTLWRDAALLIGTK